MQAFYAAVADPEGPPDRSWGLDSDYRRGWHWVAAPVGRRLEPMALMPNGDIGWAVSQVRSLVTVGDAG